MRNRWILLVAATVALMALTAGIAFAAGRGSAAPTSTTYATTFGPGWQGMVQACDAMHGSPAMEAMHERMPGDIQARCDAMHEQMDQMMQGADSMMGGQGMMGGPGMMTGGWMADHHASTGE